MMQNVRRYIPVPNCYRKIIDNATGGVSDERASEIYEATYNCGYIASWSNASIEQLNSAIREIQKYNIGSHAN